MWASAARCALRSDRPRALPSWHGRDRMVYPATVRPTAVARSGDAVARSVESDQVRQGDVRKCTGRARPNNELQITSMLSASLPFRGKSGLIRYPVHHPGFG